MIICEKEKWVFIRNPKTASRSTTNYLINNFECFSIKKYHSTEIPNEYKNFDVFICIRNPLSRAISTWLHMKEQWGLLNLNLNQFFDYKTNIVLDGDGDNFFFQSDIFEKINKINKNIKIIYFEKIEKDIIKYFKKKQNLEKIGQRSNPWDWLNYYKNNNYYKILEKDLNKFKHYKKKYI